MKKSKENTKSLILQTASNLFQRQGYHGTGLNQIIEESGAPKGSLYYHFPNGKEEIAVEAINLMKKLVETRVQEDLSEKETAAEAFQHHLNKIADDFDQRGNLEGLPVGLIASETALVYPNLRLACESAYQTWQSLYADKLKKSGLDQSKAEELGVVISAMIEGAIILSKTTKSGQPLRVMAKQVPLLIPRL